MRFPFVSHDRCTFFQRTIMRFSIGGLPGCSLIDFNTSFRYILRQIARIDRNTISGGYRVDSVAWLAFVSMFRIQREKND